MTQHEEVINYLIEIKLELAKCNLIANRVLEHEVKLGNHEQRITVLENKPQPQPLFKRFFAWLKGTV